ncbi:hypothetical protein [Streptomyces phage phiScoe1]|nr:hypothetical protein [Streptomyces phage phiScoe1]
MSSRSGRRVAPTRTILLAQVVRLLLSSMQSMNVVVRVCPLGFPPVGGTTRGRPQPSLGTLMFGCTGRACGMSSRFRATQFSFVRGRADRSGGGGRVLLGPVAVDEDVGHRLRVVVGGVKRRAREHDGGGDRSRQGEGGGCPLGDRANRPSWRRLDVVLRDGGQVDPDGAVLQELGLALVLVQGLKPPAPGGCQDGPHVAGLVAGLRVDVEVVVVLVHDEPDQPVSGGALPVPASNLRFGVHPQAVCHLPTSFCASVAEEIHLAGSPRKCQVRILLKPSPALTGSSCSGSLTPETCGWLHGDNRFFEPSRICPYAGHDGAPRTSTTGGSASG